MGNMPADLRVNAAFPFPALVTGTGPITIAKQSGIWTVGYTIDGFPAAIPPSSAYPTDYLLCWDSVAKVYFKISISTIISGATNPNFDPSDVGFDVWVLVGQSNMVGNGHSFDPNLDTADPRISQFPDADAPGAPHDTVSPANDPLNFSGSPMVGPPALIGPAMAFARTLLKDLKLNRSILLIPQAVNGSAFSAGQWQSAPTQAQIVVSATGTGTVGDAITINGVTITTVASGPTGNQIVFSSTPTTLAQNLATFVNANTGTLGGSAGTVGNIAYDGTPGFVFTATASGSAGNSIVISRTGTSFLVGGGSSNNLGGGSTAINNLFTISVTQANKAIALSPKNRIAGFLWLQGEADSTMQGAFYQSMLDAMINAFRAQITGALQAPFIAVGMVPEWVASVAQVQPIDLVHKRLPARLTRTAFAPGATGSADSTVFHYDAPSQRKNGASAYSALARATGNVVGGVASPPTGITVTGVTQAQFNIAWLPSQGPNTRVVSWLVQWRVSGSGGSFTSQSLDIAVKSTLVTGLNAATSYEVQVLGVNELGNGTPAIVTVTTLPVTFLLDTITEPVAAAFSLRKLRSAYAGKCLRAHRVSDAAETDIGFDINGVVDVVALQSFGGSGTVTVAEWYDQSGNTNDAIQATAASQPQIIVSGTLQSVKGYPAINNYASGTTPIYLQSTTGYPVAANVTVSAVIFEPTGSGTMNVIGPLPAGNHSMLLDHRLGYQFQTGGTVLASTSLPAGGPFSVGVVYTQSTGQAVIWQSGLNKASGAMLVASADAGFQIGTFRGVASNSTQFVGLFQQVLIFSAPLSASEMQAIAAADAMAWNAI